MFIGAGESVCVCVCVSPSPLEKVKLDLGSRWAPPRFLEGLEVFPLPSTYSLGWHEHKATNRNDTRQRKQSIILSSNLTFLNHYC